MLGKSTKKLIIKANKAPVNKKGDHLVAFFIDRLFIHLKASKQTTINRDISTRNVARITRRQETNGIRNFYWLA